MRERSKREEEVGRGIFASKLQHSFNNPFHKERRGKETQAKRKLKIFICIVDSAN